MGEVEALGGIGAESGWREGVEAGEEEEGIAAHPEAGFKVGDFGDEVEGGAGLGESGCAVLGKFLENGIEVLLGWARWLGWVAELLGESLECWVGRVFGEGCAQELFKLAVGLVVFEQAEDDFGEVLASGDRIQILIKLKTDHLGQLGLAGKGAEEGFLELSEFGSCELYGLAIALSIARLLRAYCFFAVAKYHWRNVGKYLRTSCSVSSSAS